MGALTTEQLQSEYDLTEVLQSSSEQLEEYETLSRLAVTRLTHFLDLPYTASLCNRQTLDIFLPNGIAFNAQQPAPVVIFIHGGYWRANSKDSRRFPALAMAERGIAWIPLNYRLAPDYTIPDIVDDVRRAVSWVYKNAKQFGCNPERLFVCGNSAGGHLAATLLMDGWQQSFQLPGNVLKGGCALSGLFELEPLLDGGPNEWLHMDRDTAHRYSPARDISADSPPLIITCGGKETSEFRRQSRDYAALCTQKHRPVTYFELAEENHFSIIGKLSDPQSRLFRALTDMISEL